MQVIRQFFKLESSAGILLAIAAAFALIVENSPLQSLYDLILKLPLVITIGEWSVGKPILLWINDGLMAIFFLLVTLEIKREIMEGELSTRNQVTLPAVAALGGFIAPALIYFYFNHASDISIRGWAIPAATDIAFALGVISLLGNRVPKELKLCLVAIAIMDDIAAILVIALFYTSKLSYISLFLASLGVVFLFALNYYGIKRVSSYVVVGIFVWLCVLKSGVHATLAGVILGAFIPNKSKNKGASTMLKKLETDLHPWVAYGVLPIFAFANAGVPLDGLSLEVLSNPITLGIILGLSVGAPAGVMTVSSILFATKLSKLPKNTTMQQYFGMAMLTGIGFTMSLFIGTLAFEDMANQNAVRLGVICGSLISASIGLTILYNVKPKAIKKRRA